MFLDPAEFEITSALESSWQQIRDEYIALPNDAFDPWVQRRMYGKGWSVYGLFADGEHIDGACAKCPKTAELIRSIDGVSRAGFSRLAPHTHIKAHVGWAVSVYRLHLGLVVPQGCRLRVANDTKRWEEGKCLIFDDTVDHEAWNDSDQIRGILLLDFLRPGITELREDEAPEDVRRFVESLKNQ
jgi:beta-hydroxylase